MRDNRHIISLMYHDLVDDAATSASGFRGAAADRYKQTPENFESHLDAIARRCSTAQAIAYDAALSQKGDSTPWLVTFDDGGVSAINAATRLERRGSIGHFFVTTSRIGTSGFLNEDQIRSLHRSGHVIGSHSHTHPAPISALNDAELLSEWRQSVTLLSEVIGEPVTVASVPGGFYSKRIAHAAARAGIRTLFTSEPVSWIASVHGCTILGRYTILRRTSADVAAAFADGAPWTCFQQRATWNLKKSAKWLLGTRYIHSTRKLHDRLKGRNRPSTEPAARNRRASQHR